MSIYLHNRQQPISLRPTDPPLDTFIDGWSANTVIVDNYSNGYLYIPNSPKFIDPGVHHAIVTLPSVTRLQAIFQAPTGFAQPPFGPNDVALLTFLEDSQPASPGLPSSIALGEFLTTLKATSTVNQIFPVPIPPGSVALGVTYRKGTSIAFPNTVKFVGHQSGYQYNAGMMTAQFIAFPVPLVDSQVDVTFSSSSTVNPAFIDIWLYRSLPSFAVTPAQTAQDWIYIEDTLTNLNGKTLVTNPNGFLAVFQWELSVTAAGQIALRDGGFVPGQGKFAFLDAANALSLTGDAGGAILAGPPSDVIIDTNSAAATGRVFLAYSNI